MLRTTLTNYKLVLFLLRSTAFSLLIAVDTYFFVYQRHKASVVRQHRETANVVITLLLGLGISLITTNFWALGGEKKKAGGLLGQYWVNGGLKKPILIKTRPCGFSHCHE